MTSPTNPDDFSCPCTFCGADIRRSMRHRYYDYDHRSADPETMVMSSHCGECGEMISYSVYEHDPNRHSWWRELVEN